MRLGQRVSVPPRGIQPASVGTLCEIVGRTAVVDLDNHPGDPLYIDADLLRGEWHPANNGSGARIHFLIRDAAELNDRYHYAANGRLIRYASNRTAQKAADKLNREEGFQKLAGCYEVDECEAGFVVLATERAPEREAGEVVAGAYGSRARAARVCRHLCAGWSVERANRYEWPDGRMAHPRSLD